MSCSFHFKFNSLLLIMDNILPPKLSSRIFFRFIIQSPPPKYWSRIFLSKCSVSKYKNAGVLKLAKYLSSKSISKSWLISFITTISTSEYMILSYLSNSFIKVGIHLYNASFVKTVSLICLEKLL